MSQPEGKMIMNVHVPISLYDKVMGEKPPAMSRNSYVLALLTKGFWTLEEERSHECQGQWGCVGDGVAPSGHPGIARHG